MYAITLLRKCATSWPSAVARQGRQRWPWLNPRTILISAWCFPNVPPQPGHTLFCNRPISRMSASVVPGSFGSESASGDVIGSVFEHSYISNSFRNFQLIQLFEQPNNDP